MDFCSLDCHGLFYEDYTEKPLPVLKLIYDAHLLLTWLS